MAKQTYIRLRPKKLRGAAKHSRKLKRAFKTKRTAAKLYGAARKEIRALEIAIRGLYGKIPNLTMHEVGKIHELHGNLREIVGRAKEHFNNVV